MKKHLQALYYVLLAGTLLVLPGCEHDLPTAGPALGIREQLVGSWVATSVIGKYSVGAAPDQADTLVSFPVSAREVAGQLLPDTLSIRTESEADTFTIYNRSALLPEAERVVNGGRWSVARTAPPEGPGREVAFLRLGRFAPARGNTRSRWFYGINASSNPNSSLNNNLVYTIQGITADQLVVSYTMPTYVPVGGVDLAGSPLRANRDVLYTATLRRL